MSKRSFTLMLAYGANPNAATPTGEKALQQAQHRNLPKIVQILRVHGAQD